MQTTGPVPADSFNADRDNVHMGDQSPAELIIYDTPLTSDQMTQMQTYLMPSGSACGSSGVANNLLPVATHVVGTGGTAATLDLSGINQTVHSLTVGSSGP